MLIKYPLMLNTNGEIQGKDGVVLMSVKRFFIDVGMREFGERVVEVLNDEPILFGGDVVKVGGDVVIQSVEDGEKLKAESVSEFSGMDGDKIFVDGGKVGVPVMKRGRGRPRKVR